MAKKPRGEEEITTDEAFRSLGRFFSWMEGKISPGTEFREHMGKSRVEFLKGIRSLVDKKIDDLERRHGKREGKKATKIKVE
ncbi:MAG: hypothetical protein JRF35_11010 [Deltaproteobacteria bacterium]|nr:hypothetical protein [Deltaproteobacteria bacterium]